MTDFRVKGRHVLAGVVGFFAIVIVANAIFIIAALRSFPGEEEQKPYFQGLRYNDAIEERRRQEALGWRATVERAERRDDGGGVIELIIRDGEGGPMRSLTVTGGLARPASDAVHTLEFVSLGEGRFQADIGKLDAGVWDLAAQAVDGAGQRFDVKARLVFK